MSHENQKLIAEDDNKRSEFIYKFISSKNQFNSGKDIKTPRVIVQFWHCHDELPLDVLKCIESWKILKEKGFEFKLFDDASAKTFISENFAEEYLLSYLKCHHPAMRCDYFRLCYLYICGGFYVDCDELYSTHEIDSLYLDNDIKIQPLCYNVERDRMVDIEDYLEKPYDKNNIYYFNNNPIVTPPKHELLFIALKRATNRLTNEENLFDIQSTTGPGNLTAAVVSYLLKKESGVNIIKNWNKISDSPWPLSYRNDDRNWRLYDGKNKKWFS